jgi:hypothetical protein
MNTTQIRTELLAQHQRLRAMIEDARGAIERDPMGQPEDDDGPAACLSRLASALQDHNLCEERLLKTFLLTVDAWGPVRAEVMGERHVAEHEELHAALAMPTFKPEPVRRLLTRLVEHMVREEQAFLGEDVLRDDVVVDAFGG